MSTPLTVYIAETAQGTGDGLSLANAHAFASAADHTWLKNLAASRSQELLGNPNDVGLNEATTVRTVTAGLEPGYGDKSYITEERAAVYVWRVAFVSDKGNLKFSDNGTTSGAWHTITATPPPPVDPLTAGQPGQPPIRLFHFVSVRSSDGKMTHQVPSGTFTTRSVQIPFKGGDPSTWGDPANYTVKGTGVFATTVWTGPTITLTKTWQVEDPSPIRTVIVGNRTPDPRTPAQVAAKVQWNVGVPITVYDPDGTTVEPVVKDSSGKAITLDKGQLYDPATKAVTTVTSSYQVGAYGFFIDGCGVVFQGFEFRDMQAPFSYGNGGTTPNHFHAFRDIVVSNAKYFVWRGNYRYDVEFTRCALTGVSQKQFGPGQYCQRWNLSDITSVGNWNVGDQFPSLIGAADGQTSDANAFHCGVFRWERVIAENFWTGTPSGNSYDNGDGIDFEGWGEAVRDFYCDRTPDGAIDNKTKPYWVNWPATAVFNAYFGRNKRAYRSWPPAGYPGKTAPHILRDVTMDDARQYGLFMVGGAAHHKFVDWHNPDGRANFMNTTGRSYTAVSNDGNVDGNMDAVIHRLFDARSTGPMSSGLNANTALGVGGSYRARLWSPKTPPVTPAMSVNGSSADDGTPVNVAVGSTVQISFPNLPAGTVITPTVSGPSAVTQNGTTVTVTAEV